MESGKTGEACVGANEGGVVLDGEGSEPGVVQVVTDEAVAANEFLKNLTMTGSRDQAEGFGIALEIAPKFECGVNGGYAQAWEGGDAEEGDFHQFA
jgi:hypothetical protein